MTDLRERPPADVLALPPPRTCGRHRTPLLIAALSALLWLPTLVRPLSSDEGGFLLVASQWAPGTSLYGNYWVDRPPLLIGLFQLADLGGGAVALRVLGIFAVVVSVLLAGAIGRVAVPRSAGAVRLTSATAAILLTTPLFGAQEVDGELLAVPFVLVAVLLVLRALRSDRSAGWWAAAGVAAMAAPLVKQSMADALVLAATTILWMFLRRGARPAISAAAAFTLGAGCLLGLVLTWSAAHGTGPVGLWQAVVVFRADAATVISSQASATTPHRAIQLAGSLLASGAVAIAAAALLPGRVRGHREVAPALPDARMVAAVVLAWEGMGVAFGGSYWLHYLLGLVPGLVLAAAAVVEHRPERVRWTWAALAYGLMVSVVASICLTANDTASSSDVAVADYLAAHKKPGDTAVVGFGDPAILEMAGLTSPYPQLWSLPVRVLDPGLAVLSGVLEGTNRPTWVVVSGDSLATWGVDATRAQPVLEREYREVTADGEYHVYEVRGGR